MSVFNVDHLGIEMAGLEDMLKRASRLLLALAYHEYQKQRHLLGDLSFSDWADKMITDFESSSDCPNNYPRD